MLRDWLLVLRPWSFTATIIPLSLGAALAWDEGIFDPILFFATILAGLAVHAGTNLSNTYGDYVTGVDTLESASHLQVVSGLIEAEAVLHALHIAARAGVAVPVPGPAQIRARLEDLHRKAQLAQPVQLVHPGDAGADDDRVEGANPCRAVACLGYGTVEHRILPFAAARPVGSAPSFDLWLSKA